MSRIRYVAVLVGAFLGCILLWPATALAQVPPSDPTGAPPPQPPSPPLHSAAHTSHSWTVLLVVVGISLIAVVAVVVGRRSRRRFGAHAST